MNAAATAKHVDLTGRTALVTGSSRGIGRAIAVALAEAGARVILNGSRESAPLSEAAAEIRAAGGEALTAIGDLSTPAGTDALIARCRELTDRIDILVLNASIQTYIRVENYDDAEFRREFQTNLGSCFQLVQAFSPGMRERRWGRIITVGSINQLRPAARLSIYSTTKAALANLTENLAKEFAPDGVTVNNLVPGVILTDRNREALKDETLRESIRSDIPAGRFGNTAECVGAALLFASDAGSYITGARLVVAGGWQL